MNESNQTSDDIIRKGDTNKKFGECEVCDKTDVIISLHYGNMWFCKECWEKEVKHTETHMSPESQAARVNESNAKQIALHEVAVQTSRAVDNSIQVRTDLFNAATVSIINLKSEIDANDSITNKPYHLAQELMTRFEHYKQVVFEMQEKIVAAGNEQKAIQVYLNQLANTLRVEEREKLKISDISYQPTKIKPVKPASIKTTGTHKVKFDKVELRKCAAEIGVSEFTLQMLVVSKGITVQEAATILKKSIADSKLVNTNQPVTE